MDERRVARLEGREESVAADRRADRRRVGIEVAAAEAALDGALTTAPVAVVAVTIVALLTDRRVEPPIGADISARVEVVLLQARADEDSDERPAGARRGA
jgi:hypothetical protein